MQNKLHTAHGCYAQTYTESTAALCLATISRRLSFCTAVSMSFSGVHSSSIRMILAGVSNLASLATAHVSLTSLSTAAIKSLLAHNAASSVSALMPSDAA